MDDGGRNPVPVVLIIAVALELIDYGWTGWDILQDLRTLQDPCADEEEQFWARLSIGLAVGCELIEPDDLLPIGLPIDDFARRQLQSVAKRVFKEEGYEGLIRLFRKELGSEVGEKVLKALGVRTEDYAWRFKKALGRSPLSGHDLHYGFPQAEGFVEWFRKAGVELIPSSAARGIRSLIPTSARLSVLCGPSLVSRGRGRSAKASPAE